MMRKIPRTTRFQAVSALGLICGFGTASAQSELALEEVIVTAQKREQSLQDVASAVTNLNGEDFDVLNISDPFDMSDKVPGLVLTNVQGYRRTIAIRGIGNELPDNAATKPGVAYHVDGVFMSNDFALFQDLVDIDRVEVTRGPDGTIYGNSSSGGAVNVITRKPHFDGVSGFIDGEIGNYSAVNIRGTFNLPLSETVAVKASGSHRSHDGYTRNVPNPTASPLNVPGAFNDLDDENDTSFNGQLLWKPTEGFSALVSFQSFDMDIDGPALKGGFDTVSDDPRVVSHDTTEFFKVKNSSTSLILDWATPFANVKGLFSYQEYKMQRRLDADRSPLTANDPPPLPLVGIVDLLGELRIRQHVGGLTQEDETYTAEINVSSLDERSDRFGWQFGAFYLDTDIESNTRNFFDAGRDGLPVNTTIVGFGNPDTEFQNSDIRSFESYAFFGQLSFRIADSFTLTGGARWTKNDFTDLRCNIFSRCLTNAGRTGTPATPAEDDSNVTFKVAIDYSPTEDNMVYASVATGIKPAASNNGFVQDPNGIGFFPEIFDEEEVTSYEIGSKNFFFDRRLRVNAAAYYYDIDNYLFNSAGLNLTGSGVSGGSNLPSSEVYGLEVESVAALRDDLRLDASVTIADSKIRTGRFAVDRAEQINITAGLTDPAARTAAIQSIAQDLTGNELPKIPEFVANVRLTYDREILDKGVLTTTVSYNHRGEYFARVYNSPRDVVPSYDLVDLNFHFQPHGSDWNFDFGVQNLFNEDEVSSVHTDDFFQGVTSFQLLPPRLVSLRARYNF